MMRKLFNKYTIIIAGFYIFWLAILPFILTGCANCFCKYFTENSNYNLTLENPNFRLSVLPTATFSAKTLKIKSKSDNLFININNPEICIRILPLITKRIHINSLSISSLEFSETIQEKLHLKKDFIQKLENSNIKLNSLNIKNFDINIYSKNLEKPINYNGENLIFSHNNRFIKFCVNSSLKIKAKKSDINLDLYFPKNNDINKIVFNVDVEKLNLADVQSYLAHYLPKDFKQMSGFIDIKADKDRLITNFIDCKCINKDNAKSIIFPKLLTVNSNFTIKSRYIYLDCVEIKAPEIDVNLKGKISDSIISRVDAIKKWFLMN